MALFDAKEEKRTVHLCLGKFMHNLFSINASVKTSKPSFIHKPLYNMKKYALLLSAVVLTALFIFACQKDRDAGKNVGQTAPADKAPTQISVGDRSAGYADCDDCAENCNDCCLVFLVETAFSDWTGGAYSMIVFTHPPDATHSTPYVSYEVLSPSTTAIKYICAMGGVVQLVNNGSSSQRIRSNVTICGGGGSIVLDSYGFKSCHSDLTWDCQWENWQNCSD